MKAGASRPTPKVNATGGTSWTGTSASQPESIKGRPPILSQIQPPYFATTTACIDGIVAWIVHS